MLTLVLLLLAAFCLLMFGKMLYSTFFGPSKKIKEDQPLPMDFYLFKIARVTGKSEYDVFCKSAEDWPVSQARIEQDFKRYLCQESVPYYVKDFVRRNKKHIDDLDIPRF
ncbi:MAG: hypothetical protein JSW26_15005 [Desulfobacterales bacterium]|nr:MAG: hypothetical protein JSW26_15005 [Desulfobacterales bacterium]